MNKHNTLVQGNPKKVQISQLKMYRQGTERSQNKRTRFSSPRGRGRDRSKGRVRSYNPHMMFRNTKYNFQPETKVYSKEEYKNLTSNQKGQVLALKQRNVWIDGCTPSPGFQISKIAGEKQNQTIK